jgi:hypothetical protein
MRSIRTLLCARPLSITSHGTPSLLSGQSVTCSPHAQSHTAPTHRTPPRASVGRLIGRVCGCLFVCYHFGECDDNGGDDCDGNGDGDRGGDGFDVTATDRGVIGGALALFLIGFACVSLYLYCSGSKARG